MFFSKKQPSVQPRYLTFMYKAVKYRHVLTHLGQAIGSRTLLLYFFHQTGQEIRQLLTASGIPFSESDHPLGTGVVIVHDTQLSGVIQPTDVVLAVEIHPSARVMTDALRHIAPTQSFTCFTALDEPLMRIFGQERLMALMTMLGMDENEAIEHHMVSKSIEKAQQALDKRMPNQRDIRDSAEAWETANRQA
jgi:hypothetical protein